jgi:hypothetical protein
VLPERQRQFERGVALVAVVFIVGHKSSPAARFMAPLDTGNFALLPGKCNRDSLAGFKVEQRVVRQAVPLYDALT